MLGELSIGLRFAVQIECRVGRPASRCASRRFRRGRASDRREVCGPRLPAGPDRHGAARRGRSAQPRFEAQDRGWGGRSGRRRRTNQEERPADGSTGPVPLSPPPRGAPDGSRASGCRRRPPSARRRVQASCRSGTRVTSRCRRLNEGEGTGATEEARGPAHSDTQSPLALRNGCCFSARYCARGLPRRSRDVRPRSSSTGGRQAPAACRCDTAGPRRRRTRTHRRR